jgi:hypothetical protein
MEVVLVVGFVLMLAVLVLPGLVGLGFKGMEDGRQRRSQSKGRLWEAQNRAGPSDGRLTPIPILRNLHGGNLPASHSILGRSIAPVPQCSVTRGAESATRKLHHAIPWSLSDWIHGNLGGTTTAAWPRVADRPPDGPPSHSTLGGSIASVPQCSVTRGQSTTRKRRYSIPWSLSDGMSALWARKTPTK